MMSFQKFWKLLPNQIIFKAFILGGFDGLGETSHSDRTVISTSFSR